MNKNRIQVQSVYTSGDDVAVTFTDGFKARYEPYTHGFGYQVEGLRRFHLQSATKNVCEYNGRLYRAGPQSNEHKIVTLAEGWTQQQVAAYWQAAREYLNKEYFEKPDKKRDEKLWYPWMLVCTEGGSDRQRLADGVAEFLGGE
jgi:hypothetical protein